MTNSKRLKLAVVASHAIQYNAPLFRELTTRADLSLRVFYSWEGTKRQRDPEFGHPVHWDIPLLEGYESQMVANQARDPGTHHFGGLNNPEMLSAIEAWAPDMVLVYGWASRTHLAVMRHFKGRIPVLFRGDSTRLTGAKGLKRLFRFQVLRWIYSHVDLCLYPGQRNREYLLACGVTERKLVWMPHAVENARFADQAQEAERVAADERGRLGIPAEAVVFEFAGKLVSRKQPEMLMQSFLCDEWPSIPPHLIFVGSGPMEAELRAMSRASERVHFLGFRNQTEMPSAYRLGDVFVLPSKGETWGLAVNEAMACARPVIVSDQVGCAPDLAADRSFARTFDGSSTSSLKAALVDLGSRQGDLKEMGLAAQRYIQNWSIERAASCLTEAASRLASASRAA